MALYTEVLKTSFLPYVKSIQGFHFYFNNPLFWAFFMILFLMLEIGWSWSQGKAFFFCLTIAMILLGTTWFEKFMMGAFVNLNGAFDPFLIKVLSLIVISAVIVYFVLIDNS